MTDDVAWEIPGFFKITGKEAFDREIENAAFVSPPVIRHIRMVEGNDVVIVEGTVRTKKKDGGFKNIVFCDVFVMTDDKIKALTSCLMEVWK